MSEFEQNWPISENLQDHQRYAADAVDMIRSRLVLPEDGRWEIAYGALAMGDPKASVLAEGEPGTGKTQFGNIVFGEDQRTDIAATDTPETLEGYLRPTDGVFNTGKMPLDQNNVRLFLNEISHLRDTGPLHKYWDGKVLNINGTQYPLDNAPVYATTNFADGGRAKRLDPALRSRMGVTVLSGDNADAVSRIIQNRDLGREDVTLEGGLLPSPKARQQIKDQLQLQYRLGRGSNDFMVDMMANMNETGLFMPINPSDARIGEGWQQAARARRFVLNSDRREAIGVNELAQIAPLALGSVAMLSQRGGGEFRDRLGKIDTLSPLEKAVIVRRAVSLIAVKTVLDTDALSKVTDKQIDSHLQRYSYANSTDADAINGAVVDIVMNSDKGGKEVRHEPKSRNIFGFKFSS